MRLSLPGEHPALTFKEAGANSQQTPLQVAQRALMPTIKPDIFIEYGLRVRIDPEAFINKGCVILDSPVADVTIGAGTSLGPRVSIYSVNHSLAQDANGKRSTLGEPVTIGDGCWIGGGTTIM